MHARYISTSINTKSKQLIRVYFKPIHTDIRHTRCIDLIWMRFGYLSKYWPFSAPPHTHCLPIHLHPQFGIEIDWRSHKIWIYAHWTEFMRLRLFVYVCTQKGSEQMKLVNNSGANRTSQKSRWNLWWNFCFRLPLAAALPCSFLWKEWVFAENELFQKIIAPISGTIASNFRSDCFSDFYCRKRKRGWVGGGDPPPQ